MNVLARPWTGTDLQRPSFCPSFQSHPTLICAPSLRCGHDTTPRASTRTHATNSRFKRSITTTETIQAAPAAVWAALTDFASFPDWNPLIVAIEGPQPLSAGDRLSFTIELPGGGGGRFTPLVLAAQPGQELRWRGSLPLPGLFTGERFIRLIEEGPGATRVVHGEHLWGLLIPALGDVIRRTEEGFGAMNAALKRRVEGPAP